MLRMGFSNFFSTQPKCHQMKFPLFFPKLSLSHELCDMVKQAAFCILAKK